MMEEPSEARKRVATACEACRLTKIKCQPNEQPGVCQKCLESKRECISRTGPRTRRSRRQKLAHEMGIPGGAAAPAGPSGTFSIDFDMPAQDEVDDNFDDLRETHANFLESLLPTEAHELDFSSSSIASFSSVPPSLANAPSSQLPTPTPSSSRSHSHSIHSLGGSKPSFNMSSAQYLLQSFRSMLHHFPCVILGGGGGGADGEEVSVSQLAASRPFVLLAILAAASGSRTLQGHNLYEEEFRKVLGMKFVAGGERSLELLQGILIYCAWYPYHLRPKSKHGLQYMRMAMDLVNDLDLDQEPHSPTELLKPDLDRIRAYLAFFYATSAFFESRRFLKGFPARFTSWTATCCDILERNAQVDDDIVLVYLARLASSFNDVTQATDRQRGMADHQQQHLVRLGLEAQLRELQGKIPPHIAEKVPLKLAMSFATFYLDCAPVLKLPRPKPTRAPSTTTNTTNAYQSLDLSAYPSLSKLQSSIPPLNTFFETLISLDQSAFLSFCGVDWSRLILATILGLRLSFPAPECPIWDAEQARSQMRYEAFLAKMSGADEEDLTPASRKVDILSASKVVLRMVKEKYERKLERVNAATAAFAAAEAAALEMSASGAGGTAGGHPGNMPDAVAAIATRSAGCPMLDGSLEQYFPLWAGGLPSALDSDQMQGLSSSSSSDLAPGNQPLVFHDLWATMTMGWADQDPTFE